MIHVCEGERAEVALPSRDVEHLKQALGSMSEIEAKRVLVRRVAGLWVLPSGASLVVTPRRFQGADLFSWMCAVDPRLMGKFQGLSSEGGADGNVAEVAVRAFCSHLSAVLRRNGPRLLYRERREDLSALRGRMNWPVFARQAVQLRVPCIHWLRDLDTPLHRLFSSVLRRIAEHDALRRAGGPELLQLSDMFAHVPALPPATVLDLERPLSRLEVEFEPARRLAVVLREGLGMALGGGQSALTFQVDLWRLFEQSIQQAVLAVPWSLPPQFQARPPYEGDDGGDASFMDALVFGPSGPLVIDAKYTSSFSKAHLYQVLAYMKMMGAARGALVYPKGAALGSRSFRSRGRAPWEVQVLEVDPVEVARDPARALRALGEQLAEFAGMGLVAFSNAASFSRVNESR